jgi:hypothetical protein
LVYDLKVKNEKNELLKKVEQIVESWNCIINISKCEFGCTAILSL